MIQSPTKTTRHDVKWSFATVLRACRGRLGISQEELARRVGTSYSAISRIESGRHKTSVETLQRLAHALGVRLVVGFESGPADRPVRELVSA